MLTIREAVPDDAEALGVLYLRYLTPTPSCEEQDYSLWKEKIAGFAKDDHYHLFVGVYDGRVVCSVTLIVIENLTHNVRPYAVIENVVTHGDFRSRGYATRLMRHACDTAKNGGCYKVMLMTGSKEESVFNFYRNCGFDQNEKTAFILRF